MNLRSCLYFEKKEDLARFSDQQPADFITFTNKFRACILLNEENSLTPQTISRDSVIRIHEVLTHYLTYQKEHEDGTWHRRNGPLIMSASDQLWIQDVDVWFGLPVELNSIIKTYGSHIFCFGDIKFIYDMK